MKKALILFMIFSIFVSAGCSALSGVESAAAETAQLTLAATATTTASPSPAQTSIPVPTPTPQNIQEKARFSVDLNGDGEDETIIVSSEEVDDMFERVMVGVLAKTTYNEVLVEESSFFSAYLVRTQRGETCVLISCQSPVDNCGNTYPCSFNELTPVLGGRESGLIAEIDGTELTLENWTDFIGSWYYTREFQLNDDFTLEPVSEMMLVTEDREPLHTIRDLPVEMQVGGGYVEDTLPADTLLWPVSADGEGHLTFRLADGRTGRITYKMDNDYNKLIAGVDVSDYFDNIEYWG